MTHGKDFEIIEDFVNKGIWFQREGKHKEAIVCFDKAMSLDKNINGEVDSNITLLKENSLMKID